MTIMQYTFITVKHYVMGKTNRISHGWGWKTDLSNPRDSGGREWTRAQRGSDPRLARGYT